MQEPGQTLGPAAKSCVQKLPSAAETGTNAEDYWWETALKPRR